MRSSLDYDYLQTLVAAYGVHNLEFTVPMR